MKSRQARTAQINVRMTEEQKRLLRTVAELHQRSEQDLILELLEAYLAAQANDPRIQATMRFKAEIQAESKGELSRVIGVGKGHSKRRR